MSSGLLNSAGTMAPGAAGEALTGSASTVGSAVQAGQTGNYGDMGSAIM